MASLIKGKTGEWEMVIGLEVHAQVISRAKLFSGAATAFGAEPNTQVSLVDAAMPGMLPVVNGFVIEQAVKSGLGLKARINLHSVFERKNYFYPDLPPGYQISQYLEPIVGNGTLLLDLPDGATREVGIERLHLEMDAGKSLHDQHPSQTYVDLNRSGVALMEIVVSVRRPGADLGTRTETKNLNSIRFVEQAIEVEARRQVALLEEGGEVVQETRLFDSAKGRTRPMRSKEEAHDYRYFPDPDLLPLELDPAWVEGLEASLPELPDAKKERFMADFGLPAYDAGVLVGERETAEFYEAVVAGKRDPKAAANWVTGAYFGALNRTGETLDTAPVDAAALGGLLDLIADKTISGRIAKDVFDEMWKTGKSAAEIVEEKGLRQITDTGAIEGILDEIIAGAPAQVEQFKSGNEKVLGWFVGQAMKATQGKANPGLVNQLLRQKLGK
jgi:aspartyl-tRNA(Asn)/glutamyl-tRNA(Gln) amidotransferase subunit B